MNIGYCESQFRECFIEENAKSVEYVCKLDTLDRVCSKNFTKSKVLNMKYKCSREYSDVILDSTVFAGYERIHTLDVSSLGIENLKFTSAFGNAIENIDASHNRFTKIPAILVDMSNLNEIDFSHNQITSVAKGTFETVRNLRKLNLNYNQIKVIDEDLFAKNKNMTDLSLRGNQLMHFNSNSISNLEKLINLDLSINTIEKIDNNFMQNKQIQVLSLKGNPVKYFDFNILPCEADVKVYFPSNEILELDISCKCGCDINKFDFTDRFERIEQFNASRKIFQNIIEILRKLGENLKVLDLSSIQIITRDASGIFRRRLNQADLNNAFSAFLYLEMLNLSNNGITKIDDNLFEHNKHLKSLDLRGNPLSQVRSNKFLKKANIVHLPLKILTTITEQPKSKKSEVVTFESTTRVTPTPLLVTTSSHQLLVNISTLLTPTSNSMNVITYAAIGCLSTIISMSILAAIRCICFQKRASKINVLKVHESENGFVRDRQEENDFGNPYAIVDTSFSNVDWKNNQMPSTFTDRRNYLGFATDEPVYATINKPNRHFSRPSLLSQRNDLGVFQ